MKGCLERGKVIGEKVWESPPRRRSKRREEERRERAFGGCWELCVLWRETLETELAKHMS